VPRPPEPAKKTALLANAVDYALLHGLEGLSLRPLAAALGTSPRRLIYHFGSKDQLVAELVTAARQQLIQQLGELEETDLVNIWGCLSAPSMEPYWRLTLQVYALGLGGQAGYRAVLPAAVCDWLTTMPHEPRPGFATLVLAAVGGLILDLLGSGERERVDAAARLFAELIRQERSHDVSSPT